MSQDLQNFFAPLPGILKGDITHPIESFKSLFSKGGGKNAQKSNPDRVSSAKGKLDTLKEQRDKLQSQPNKTPEDKTNLDKVNKQINRETDRMRKSESHSQKQKGQQ